MADPVTMALIGAGTGAIMNKDDPLKGAMLGAAGGAIAGPAMGAAGNALGMGAGAAGSGVSSAVGGELLASAPGAMGQAGMLINMPTSAAAQFATGPVGSMIGSEAALKMASPLNPLFNNLAQPGKALQAGGMMMPKQGQQKPVAAPSAPRRSPAPQRSNAAIMQPYNGGMMPGQQSGAAMPGGMQGGAGPYHGMGGGPEDELMKRRRFFRPMGY